jgi:hypothetical protein
MSQKVRTVPTYAPSKKNAHQKKCPNLVMEENAALTQL